MGRNIARCKEEGWYSRIDVLDVGEGGLGGGGVGRRVACCTIKLRTYNIQLRALACLSTSRLLLKLYQPNGYNPSLKRL